MSEMTERLKWRDKHACSCCDVLSFDDVLNVLIELSERIDALEATPAAPYACPVCSGKGKVPPPDTTTASTLLICPACAGACVVWEKKP